MWEIDKEFGLDYGHRVWSQKLNTDYSEDGKCVCRHQHGHRAKIHIFLQGDTLKDGMVTDFKHLNWAKTFLDDNIDHKFIIDVNDPGFELIINGRIVNNKDNRVLSISGNRELLLVPVFVPGTEHLAGHTLNLTDELSDVERELYEGFFIVGFVPTSEHLSKWIYDCVDAKMSMIGVVVSKIDWYETPKSRSSYTRL